MKRAISVLVLLLAGCSGAKDGEGPSAPSASASAAPAAQPSAPVEARKVSVSNELIEFDYAYPAQAAAIPALKALLDADLERQQAEIRKGAEEGRKDAAANGFPFNAYSHTTEWKVVTELPGWLSLSADRWEFTGGAHGNPWFDSLLWDKAANLRRKPTDLFVSPAALSAAIRPAFCDQIDRQRVEKRGAPVNRDSGDEFDACIDPVESTIILGSSDRQHFDRIGVLVGPYAAGPYVEGEYEATVPVTARVLAAVKPEYRQFFAAGR